MALKRQPDAKGKKTKVLLVDDHPVVRRGLEQLINHEPDLVVCGEAGDSRGALEAITELRPDLAIVDVSLGDGDGIELVKDIRLRCSRLPILVLSVHDESVYAERALRAGARGYVSKHEAPEVLLEAIRRIRADDVYVSQKITSRLLRKVASDGPGVVSTPIERLSDRELRVFRFIGKGLGTRDISEKLHVSVKTVESYKEHIKEKIRLRKGTDLLQYAIQWMRSHH